MLGHGGKWQPGTGKKVFIMRSLSLSLDPSSFAQELISKPQGNKTKIIKFNWIDFDGLINVI